MVFLTNHLAVTRKRNITTTKYNKKKLKQLMKTTNIRKNKPTKLSLVQVTFMPSGRKWIGHIIQLLGQHGAILSMLDVFKN